MNKSPPTFITLLPLVILSMTRVAESNDQLSYENDIFRLRCLLFKDIGCDVECFVISKAFGKLGSGFCRVDSICQCSYAENPSLADLWREKFGRSEDLLGEIQANRDHSETAYAILAEPFKSVLQIKETLKKKLSLSEEQYSQLQVTDTSPATQINPTLNVINFLYMEKYVDKTLSKELKSRDEELSAIDLETMLLKVLNDNVDKPGIFEKLISEIRRMRNTYLTGFIDRYLAENHKGESTTDENGSNDKVDNEENGADGNDDVEHNEDVSQKVVNISEAISNSITDKLVEKVKKRTHDGWLKWVGKKITHAISSFLFWPSKSDNDVDLDKVFNDSNFFKPTSKIDIKLFRKSKPIDQTWRDDKLTLRYRGDRKNVINLNWIKNPVLVSILKTRESNVNQNWIFGTMVSINIFRTVGGDSSQTWDFGKTAYLPDKTWRDGNRDEKTLLRYKAVIRNWCDNNRFLIDKDDCVIFT